eukprot:m.60263 g.60263  ORF g.60263 m.60263 type:complete len:85 (-) comp11307_c0_seq1:218-472(-)
MESSHASIESRFRCPPREVHTSCLPSGSILLFQIMGSTTTGIELPHSWCVLTSFKLGLQIHNLWEILTVTYPIASIQKYLIAAI